MTPFEKMCTDQGMQIACVLERAPLHMHVINGGGLYVADKQVPGRDVPWEDTAWHWRVSITFNERTVRTPYKCGSGHVTRKPFAGVDYYRPTPPKAADVLSNLISDAECSDQSFADFCAELGYDEDSRRALETYLACQNAGREVRRLLGARYAEFRALAGEH